MKVLKRLLLRNWHYITFEIIEFDKITYLTGKTGSGKSTMVDALQLLVLGDTNAHFFNKAANEKSERTIEGYLKGLISKQDQDSQGEYLRGDVDFSSYIVGEFYDDLKNEYLTFGLIFDCFAGEKPEYRYFWMDTSIQEDFFVVDNDLVGISQLSDYLIRLKVKYEIYPSNTKVKSFSGCKFVRQKVYIKKVIVALKYSRSFYIPMDIWRPQCRIYSTTLDNEPPMVCCLASLAPPQLNKKRGFVRGMMPGGQPNIPCTHYQELSRHKRHD